MQHDAGDVTLSILDLATVGRGQTPADAFRASVALAQAAEAGGYRRVWYAEHHNIASVASSAPAVLIAHVAAHTSTIRLGAGGVMLPNHSPLVVAEQFGTLAELHPGRIDLGLGRAPGSDQVTFRALRRDPRAAEHFAHDIVELQGFLGTESTVAGVRAIPGAGTDIPLYVLGSSLFGAQVAAHLGLPYAFASHFAPAALEEAVAVYRRSFRPSAQQERPHVIAAANVIAADDETDARDQFGHVVRARAGLFLTGRTDLDDEQADRLLASPQGQQVARMMRYSAVGTPAQVAEQLGGFTAHADADELILAHASPDLEARLRSVQLVAEAMEGVTA